MQDIGTTGLAGHPPRLTGEARTDWALWSLSLLLRAIAARQAARRDEAPEERAA
jgi:hypothetical protein